MTFIEFYNTWNSLILDRPYPEIYCNNRDLSLLLCGSCTICVWAMLHLIDCNEQFKKVIYGFLVIIMLLVFYSNYSAIKNQSPNCRFYEKIYKYPGDYTINDFDEDMDKIGQAASPEQLQLAKKVMKICIEEQTQGKAGMFSCIASNENLFIDADNNIYKEKQVINEKQKEKRVQQ